MKTKIGRRSGFTLAEVLLTLILGGALSATIVEAVSSVFRIETRMANRSLALERGWNVLSILEPRVLHAALGLKDASPLPESKPISIRRDALFPANEDGDGIFRGRVLSVLYSVPSGLRAKLSAITQTGNNFNIDLLGDASQLNARVPESAIGNAHNIRSWVVFPLSGRPIRISNHSRTYFPAWLTIQSQPPIQLYPYDELHYLRAERFFVENTQLYIQNFTTAWQGLGEGMLEGVLEMWFEWAPSLHRLEAWILTTGGSSSAKNPRPSEWPATAPWKADFERQDTAVTFGSWTLKNL